MNKENLRFEKLKKMWSELGHICKYSHVDELYKIPTWSD